MFTFYCMCCACLSIGCQGHWNIFLLFLKIVLQKLGSIPLNWHGFFLDWHLLAPPKPSPNLISISKVNANPTVG